MDPVRSLRRDLHRLAERSGHEGRTAARVRAYLEDHHVPVETGVGGHGLLAHVAGRSGGPARLLRAELDALPAADGGARHGCGHDGHVAMLCGALARFAADPPPRPVTALFQPSEEDGSGMTRCLLDPRLAALPVRDCFSIHNLPGVPLGQVVLAPGALASTGLRISFAGRESHAAHPAEGLSPWPALRACADAVQGLAHADPTTLATLVHVRLGDEAYGTSPGSGVVAATLRGGDDAVAHMQDRLQDTARTAAEAHGLGCTVREVDPFPETRNAPGALDAAEAAARTAGLAVERTDAPFPWSEDFGHAAARWPGALVGLGSGTDQPPLHDDRYRFPDDLQEHGVRFWDALGRQP